jgi:hypothetical protein
MFRKQITATRLAKARRVSFQMSKPYLAMIVPAARNQIIILETIKAPR